MSPSREYYLRAACRMPAFYPATSSFSIAVHFPWGVPGHNRGVGGETCRLARTLRETPPWTSGLQDRLSKLDVCNERELAEKYALGIGIITCCKESIELHNMAEVMLF